MLRQQSAVLLKLAGHRIGLQHLGIADDLELPAIVMLEQRQEIRPTT